MSTQTTRRAIVTGIAVAPLAGLPALAGAATTNDPILSAIAEHRRLKAIARAASEAAGAADKVFDAAAGAIGVVTYKGEKILSEERLDFLAYRPQPMSEIDLEEIIQRLRTGNARLKAEASVPDHECDAARAELQQKRELFEKAREQCGVQAADEASDAAWDAEREAEIAVVASSPATPAGAAAFIRYAADFLDDLGINDTRLDGVLTAAIRNAVALLEREALA